MNKKQISAKNELIAEFMKHPILYWNDPEYLDDQEDQDYRVTSIVNNEDGESAAITFNGGNSDAEVYLHELKKIHLKYNKSWNWLMPVVEKIENCFDGEVVVNISDETCSIGHPKYPSGSVIAVTESKILSVWSAVSAFVKWYNKGNYETNT